MLSSKFFKNNRANLQKRVADSLIVITASGLLQRSADTTYPFRQDSNFYYLTGVEEPDIVLVIHNKQEYLILPKRTEVERIFGGSLNLSEIKSISGINIIYDHDEGWNVLGTALQESKVIATIKPPASKITGADSFYTNPARKTLVQKLKRANPKLKIQDVREQLVVMRQVKQLEEIKVIKKAIAITAEGFEKAKSHASNSVYEYELEACFDKTFKRYNSTHGYQPIIAGGSRACALHYIKNNQKLKSGELYLIDVGAEFSNYSADITRTYGVKQTARQTEVLDVVKSVQSEVLNFLKAGVTWRELSEYTEKCMGEALIGLKLIKTADRLTIRKYFPHGVSHNLGLDVHDVCDYKIILENMVITVEPGIYIPEEGIGVRIEDNILITKKGSVNLSADIPYA